MPGPIPKTDKRRRNTPTIPTTSLPATGRSDAPPDVPPGYDLGTAGQAWWDWAWATPQAAAWIDGNAYVVARRASLEDDLAAIERVECVDFNELADAASSKEFRQIVQRIAGLATGRVALMREMRELDDRLGMTPKAMASLRWSIAGEAPKKDKATGTSGGYSHLRSVP